MSKQANQSGGKCRTNSRGSLRNQKISRITKQIEQLLVIDDSLTGQTRNEKENLCLNSFKNI